MNKYIKSLLTILLCFVVLHVVAQQKQGDNFIPTSRNLGKSVVVDSTVATIWYALNAKNIHDINTYVDYQMLEVGGKISKYQSWFISNSEKLLAKWNHLHPHAGSAPTRLGPGGSKPYVWLQYQYSDFYIQSGQITEYACMPLHLERYNSRYTEDYPLQKWSITTDTMTILNYVCQKATCDFRGRTYDAWFTTAIPIAQGPWKFGGLPGLILKVYDTKKIYVFEAVQIKNEKTPILRYEYTGYQVRPRQTVQEFQTKFAENYYKAVGWRKVTVLPDGNVKMGESVSRETPYEPLEIELKESADTSGAK
jgi:GLPGLI family protein